MRQTYKKNLKMYISISSTETSIALLTWPKVWYCFTAKHSIQKAHPIMPILQLVHVFRSKLLPILGYNSMPGPEQSTLLSQQVLDAQTCIKASDCRVQTLIIAAHKTETAKALGCQAGHNTADCVDGHMQMCPGSAASLHASLADQDTAALQSVRCTAQNRCFLGAVCMLVIQR